MRRNERRRHWRFLTALLLSLALLLAGCGSGTGTAQETGDTGWSAGETGENDAGNSTDGAQEDAADDSSGTDEGQKRELSSLFSEIPEYSGDAYVVLNDNVPCFSEEDLTEISYETYSDLDSLGRCAAAMACIGQDLMQAEDRGDISSVYPTGWEQAEYDSVDGGYLYNRCHLIGYQLTGENDNEKNLITGTRYMNVEGMLPFENMVADYVKETGNHVLYRVTPLFEGDNLLASGVEMEALSVEDDGEGIEFHVYCYNVQPGITIDYATGESSETGDASAGSSDVESTGTETVDEGSTYILNTNTMKFHDPDCSSVDGMSEKNRQEYTGDRQELLDEGYSPCGRCSP